MPRPREIRKDRRNVIFVLWMLILIGAPIGLLAAANSYFRQNPIRFIPFKHVYFEKYEDRYRPFTRQHLDPFYFFSLPRGKPSLNNETVSINDQGFRGPRTTEAGGRPLAFVVGGSAAFGHGASADNRTIPGYLNHLQSRYFFLNAGVPSWTSTQELYRITRELVHFQPALVVAYDGYNDARTAFAYDGRYPPGTPESYQWLESKFDDVREQHVILFNPLNLPRKLFPHLSSSLRTWVLNRQFQVEQAQVPDSLGDHLLDARTIKIAQDAAEEYLRNLDAMDGVVRGLGGRFVAFFQPSAFLTHSFPQEALALFRSSPKDAAFMRAFHRHVVTRAKSRAFFHDLSGVFDSVEKSEKVGNIYLDTVHTFDPGNLLIARAMIRSFAVPAESGQNGL